MKSLYLKVLVWSILTLLMPVVGAGLRHFWESSSQVQPQRSPMRSGGRIVADMAQKLYQEGGPDVLREFLQQARAGSDSELYVIDAQGRDLLTREDRSPLLQERPNTRGRWFFQGPPSGRFVMVMSSTDDALKWVVVGNRPESSPPWDMLGWVLASVALLSWLFTVYLVMPLKNLSAVVQRFGSGDLSARANSRRSDELGQLARVFDEMASRIDGLMTAERRMLQDVSHELRTPLARLRFAIEVARTDPNQQASLDRIKKECDRLTVLTDELLDVIAAEGDPANRSSEPVAIAELLQEVVADAGIEAGARRVTLTLRAQDGMEIAGDRELVRRAVDNIVRNAIRHSPEGESIAVTATGGNPHIEIAVRDRGPGVPADVLSRIFQPFFRAEADRGRDTGGVGLGLAIAQRAVHWHHGSIAAENANPGLCVTIRLPIQQA